MKTITKNIKSFLLLSFIAFSVNACMDTESSKLQKLIKQTQAQDKSVRKKAVIALGRLNKPETVDALINSLKDEDSYIRAPAAKALGLMEAEKAVAPLIAALNDPEVQVRMSAAQALGRLKDNKALTPLMQVLENERLEHIRAAAVTALGKLGHPDAIPVLIKSLEDSSSSISGSAAEALANFNDPEVVKALQKSLNAPDSFVRGIVANSLGKLLYQQASEDKLIELLKAEENYFTKGNIVRSLGNIKSKKAAPLLIGLLDTPYPPLQQVSLAALIKIDTDEAKEAIEANRQKLISIIKGTDESVKYRAWMALAILKDQKAIDIAIGGLHYNEDNVKRMSAFALEEVDDPKAQAALKAYVRKKEFDRIGSH